MPVLNYVENGIFSISDSFYSISFMIILNTVKFNLFTGSDGVQCSNVVVIVVVAIVYYFISFLFSFHI